ncbi:MAG: GFA family protein [Caldimonas sp.]
MTQRSTYTGSCHCGRVAFELDAQLDHVVACSCSLCRKVGALWHGATDANLRIIAGEDELTLYQFNTMTARHYACRHCGVHPFSRPRLDPSRWVVNVRCIDGVDVASLPLMHFDGANWDAAAESLRAKRKPPGAS